MASDSPSANGSNGRDPVSGRFVKGYAGGPGNPHAAKMAKFRSAMMEAVTEDEVKNVIRVMVMAALTGDTQAGRLVLEYLVGKPPQYVAVGVGVEDKDTSNMSTDELIDAAVLGMVEAAFRSRGEVVDSDTPLGEDEDR